MTNKWSDEESEVLVQASGSLSLSELSEQLGRSKSAVRWQCKKLGVTYRDTRGESAKQRFTTWTPERLEALAAQVAVRPVAEVAAEFGLSSVGLRDVMYRYGIKGRGQGNQTAEEVERRIAPLRGRERVDRSVPRECSKCHLVKQPEEFRSDRNSGQICIECSNSARRVHWFTLSDDERRRRMGMRRFRAYSLSLDQAESIMSAQGGCCALCGKELGARFSVDHDHGCCDRPGSCGKCVRGFVHQRCNYMLGWVETAMNEDMMETIQSYLATHS